ncbi:MAG TPA: TadE family protein [Candidatus Obscuribacterales bacterium]
MIRIRHRSKRKKAAAIAEFAAALTLVVPIFILLMYMTYEACIYLYLKTGVDAAAKTHARWLAINFNFLCQQNGNSAANYGSWKNSSIRVANCVVSDGQFTNGTINAAGTFVTTAPAVITAGQCITGPRGQGHVAVRVLYPGGTTLPSWPYPPLTFFGKSLTPSNYTIAGIYVCDIEP